MAAFARIAKLVVFYTIFYACLAALWAAFFKLFLMTLDNKQPKWQVENSLIGSTPALTMRPFSYYNEILTVNEDTWKHSLNEFLGSYLSINRSKNVQNCNHVDAPSPGKVCDFRLTSRFLPCLPQYSYGLNFGHNSPCIFLKLNKVYGWKPEYYNRDTVPEHMPYEVVEEIKNAELRNAQEKIWVDCQPVTSQDAENIGPISYYPYRGFEGKYFPYTNIDGYLSPLVAVYFERPRTGILIRVECKVWAANIQHDRKRNQGVIQFGLVSSP